MSQNKSAQEDSTSTRGDLSKFDENWRYRIELDVRSKVIFAAFLSCCEHDNMLRGDFKDVIDLINDQITKQEHEFADLQKRILKGELAQAEADVLASSPDKPTPS